MKSAGLCLIRVLCANALIFSAALAVAQESDLPPGVIARQGDAVVSLQDIDAYAQKIPETDRVGFFDNPKRIESVIMNLLLQKQLAAEARRDKLDLDPAVQQQIQQSTDDTLARVAMDHYRKTLKLPDFDELAHEYYLTHKDEFVVHGAVDVKHVLVSIKERSEAEAKARVGEVEATARAHPEQFDALVEKYSDDPSKTDNHGLIEDAASGNMAPPFAQAADALKKPGDISPITKTEYGFHVLKLVARKPDTQRSFDEIHTALVEKLRSDYIVKQSDNHNSQLRGKPLDANPDLVASVRTRFLPAGGKLPSEQAAEINAAKLKKAAEDAKNAKSSQ
ncbi:MAG: peptidylprolyl isomerase [Rudaea sp.]|nr:peptidylprolyl isomerase [Rudaea sp.]